MMNDNIMWLALIFLAHFIDDFFLQGMCLSNLKQKEWWEQHAPDEKYKYDYLMSVSCHAMMWSISIMIPTMISGNFIWWLIPINFIIHATVDDIKANRHKINLITDQSIHFVQVILTYLVCYIWMVK